MPDAEIEGPAARAHPPHAGDERGAQAVVGFGIVLHVVAHAAHARVAGERRQRRLGLGAAIDRHLRDDGGDR